MSFATSARGGESGAGPLEAGGAAAAKTSRGMARKRAGDGEVERASGRGVGSTRKCGRKQRRNEAAPLARDAREWKNNPAAKSRTPIGPERSSGISPQISVPVAARGPPHVRCKRKRSGGFEPRVWEENLLITKVLQVGKATARTVPRLCAVAAAWRVAGCGYRGHGVRGAGGASSASFVSALLTVSALASLLGSRRISRLRARRPDVADGRGGLRAPPSKGACGVWRRWRRAKGAMASRTAARTTRCACTRPSRSAPAFNACASTAPRTPSRPACVGRLRHRPPDALFSRAGIPDYHLGGCTGEPFSNNKLDVPVCGGDGCGGSKPSCCDCADGPSDCTSSACAASAAIGQMVGRHYCWREGPAGEPPARGHAVGDRARAVRSPTLRRRLSRRSTAKRTEATMPLPATDAQSAIRRGWGALGTGGEVRVSAIGASISPTRWSGAARSRDICGMCPASLVEVSSLGVAVSRRGKPHVPRKGTPIPEVYTTTAESGGRRRDACGVCGGDDVPGMRRGPGSFSPPVLGVPGACVDFAKPEQVALVNHTCNGCDGRANSGKIVD